VFGLAEARASARKLQVVVADGGDPAMERRVAKTEAATEHIRSFGARATRSVFGGGANVF